MRSVPKIRIAETFIALTLLVLLAGVTLVSTGCDDGGEADMYAQISAGGGRSGSSPASRSNSNADTSSQQTTPAPGGGLAGGETSGLPTLPGETGEGEGGGEGEEVDGDLTLVQGIEIIELEVKAPYPDFTGADRYNIKVTLVTEDPIEPQVFSVWAIGEDGEVVAKQERDLRLPRKKAGTIHFDDWWCKSIPVALEFHTTDTEATSADGEADTGNVTERPGGRSKGGGNDADVGGTALN